MNFPRNWWALFRNNKNDRIRVIRYAISCEEKSGDGGQDKWPSYKPFFQGNRGLLFLLVFVILQLFRRKKEEKKVITGNRSANNELSLKKMAIIPIMYQAST